MNISELAKFRGGVSVDTITELTSASGVTIDGILLKDSSVTATSRVSTSTITESASGSGVTIDGILLKDNVITGDATGVKLQGGDGTAVPAGMVGYTQISATISKTASVGGWEKVVADFGVPPAGNYLMILQIESTPVASLTGVGCIVNETAISVVPVVLQVSGVASAVMSPFCSNMTKYTTDGTKTLYGWVLSQGAYTTVSATLRLYRM